MEIPSPPQTDLSTPNQPEPEEVAMKTEFFTHFITKEDYVKYSLLDSEYVTKVSSVSQNPVEYVEKVILWAYKVGRKQ